jgi:hypothetical protein
MTTRLFATSAAAAFILAAMSSSAQAQQWNPQTRDYRYSNAQGPAYDAGYRAGIQRGEQAARDRHPLDIEREREYRDATSGYNSSYSDRGRYRDEFRVGFAQGYRDGWNRVGVRGYDDRGRNGAYGYGREGDWGYGRPVVSVAFQNGLGDGYRKGLDDLQHRRYPDVNRQKWYRNGDHDYNGRYGPKDLYRVDYRRGFEDGYNRAYREGRRY